ncbi:MAG: glutaminyl-peptide cyclotransferase [Alistipes sp.]|nr:glutaminyl-peptide cyclotransferase [Alistipes sp.]
MTMIKQITTLAIVAAALLMSCGMSNKQQPESNTTTPSTQSKQKSVVAAQYDYRVVNTYPHSAASYTQGLQYIDGVMWEGTGREGKSHLQRIDLTTGKCDIVASLPKSEFGEGITHHNGRIYQLTWTEERAYVYDTNGNKIKTIPYRGEGWGITSDGEHLYMSDGSSAIRTVNPETFATESLINVTLNNMTLDLINELEWIDGSLWANIYLADIIVEIDPQNGCVIGYVDLSPLRTLLENNPEAEVLNGIAYNASNDNLYVTGKDWNRLFEIEIYK